MRIAIKLGNVNVPGSGIELKDIHLEAEAGSSELVETVSLVKGLIKELPEILTDLKTCAQAFQAIDSEMNPPKDILQDEQGSYYKVYVETHTLNTEKQSA